MSSAVAELDALLQSMLHLKPPGVSGSKITAITSLCTANVQSESVLIQKIYTHFKKAPGTHKLGVLYVVDSVTRQWIDQARKSSQLPGSGAPDGTYAAGVTRVTELLPVLMNDLINSAPEDQKARIKKLLDIWGRSSTFPAKMLSDIRDKLDVPQNNVSTTPEGSPAPGRTIFGQQQQQAPTNQPLATAAPPQQDTSAILAALANMAKSSSAAPAASGIPAQDSMSNLLGAHNGLSHTTPLSVGSTAPNGQAVNPVGALFAGMSNGVQNQNQNPSAAQQNPLAAFLPQAQAPALPQAAAPLGPEAQQQFQLIQLMAAQGIPPDQWGTALQLLNIQNGAQPGAGALPGFPPPPGANPFGGQAGGLSRDGPEYMRSPPSQYRRRSRSPGWDRRRDLSPPRRRDSPVYGDFKDNARGRGRDERGGRKGNDYRQRSPVGRGASPVRKDQPLPPPGQKYIEFDRNLGNNMIKVLSRTLFVGGVTSSEAHLRSLFANYGIVQTCIVNVDKRHAFVKMIDRKDASAARDGMETYKAGDMVLRTRWGVGFGPRDCSDYQTGVSVIPIDRLTDADRKWMVSAEYGGTGGRAIESGMVVEEPDIEIGAGVSSKAISRRMATDKGGTRGPQSSRADKDGPSHNDRRRNNEDRGDNNPNNMPLPSMPNLPNMQGMQNFPFPFPMQNGMPAFPPGFVMPQLNANNGGS